MTTPIVRAAIIAGLILLGAPDLPAQEPLPKYIAVELKHLEEMYHILDMYSTRIWPGWKNYADIPFFFTYTNGVQLLVGHPKPPDGFSLVPDIEVRSKKVFLNRTKEVPVPMTLPLTSGGGPVPYGYVDGKPVTVVKIDLQPFNNPPSQDDTRERDENFALGSENTILVYVHELFHCFQRTVPRSRHGNLRFNTDENYAAHAEIEGLALERAYRESGNPQALEYLKDCLVARELKRRSMNERERLQEAEENVSEGTATYSELMAATLIKECYTPAISRADDPFFYGFKYVDSLLEQKMSSLRSARSNTLSSRDKCYPFGCFQAALLNRFAPGWQEDFLQKGKTLDQVIDSLLPLSAHERELVAARLKNRYDFDSVYARHARVILQRNCAFESVQSRKGVAFIVDFKNTGEFLIPEESERAHSVGLIHIYSRGIRKLKVADVLFEGNDTPMVNDQIFYVKWIDTEATKGPGTYKISGLREGMGNIYKNAVFKTRGFTLTAPKIEIRETPNRVKVTILAKVKE